MPGKIDFLTGFSYPPEVQGRLKQFPVDQWNARLADLAPLLGIVQVIDPDYYDTATGVALDLETTGRFVSADKASTDLVNGYRVFAPRAGFNDGLVSSRAKAEGSWTVAGFVRQFAGNQAYNGDKYLYACGDDFTFRNLPNSPLAEAVGPGASGSFALTTVPRILMLSYDSSNRQLSIRETTGNDLDHELASVIFTTHPANGSPWEIGGGAGSVDFAGLVGQHIICNKALHRDEHAIERNLMQTLFAMKYGVRA